MVACQSWGLRTRYVGKVGHDLSTAPPASTNRRTANPGCAHFLPAQVSDRANQALRQPWHGISAAVTTNVSLRAFDTDTKKWVLLGGGARMYYALQFPTLSVPRNNSSCAVFRKEKDREFPPA